MEEDIKLILERLDSIERFLNINNISSTTLDLLLDNIKDKIYTIDDEVGRIK